LTVTPDDHGRDVRGMNQQQTSPEDHFRDAVIDTLHTRFS
jgi:hypothetical protein